MENLLVNVKEFIEKVEKNAPFDSLEFIDVFGWSNLNSITRCVVEMLNEGHTETDYHLDSKNLNTEYKVFKEATDTKNEEGYHVLVIPEGYTLDTLIEKVREEAKVVSDYIVEKFNDSYKYTELTFDASIDVTPQKFREVIDGLRAKITFSVKINK